MPSNYLILCCPLLLLPSIFPSIRVFANESGLHIRWPKYWTFSFISPSSEHPRLISFKIDWLNLLAVQGILKSLLQHHSSKASVLLCLAFFIVQLSHPYMTASWPYVYPGPLYMQFLISTVLHLWIQLTRDGVVMKYLPLKKKITYKWTHVVQTHVVQG